MKVPLHIYLSGGMHPKQVDGKKVFWHDQVQEAILSGRMIHYFDPRLNRLDFNPNLGHAGAGEEFMPHDGWGSVDLAMAGESDIVFGHLEKDNPGGEGATAETFIHKGRDPFGLRIVVLEDPLDDSKGEIRDISTGGGDFTKALIPNRARYRKFFMFAGRPYLPLDGPNDFPFLAYRTLEEGLRFYELALQQFLISDSEDPFFINLIGDASLEFRGTSWISVVREQLGSHSVVHFLNPSLGWPSPRVVDVALNGVEQRTLQDFFSWKADIVLAYAPAEGDTATYMNFAQGIAAAKAMSPHKLVVAWCPNKTVLHALGDHNLMFAELNEAIGFIRVWLKQFGYRGGRVTT